MSTTLQSPIDSPPVRNPVQTRADTMSPVNRGSNSSARSQPAWQNWIDNCLLSWLTAPHQLGDEEIETPGATTIRLALDLAELLRDRDFAAPDSVVPDPNGGIVFERRAGMDSYVYHIWDNGEVEYMLFRGSHLAERRPVQF